MGRPPIGARALTPAQKQKNYRARLKARRDSEIKQLKLLKLRVKRLTRHNKDH